MQYITKTTRCTSYGIYPRSLLHCGLSKTAIVAYLLLLDRAMVSQANDWLDEQGRVFILYPIEQLAEALERGESATRTALDELAEKGFIFRQRQGLGRPNRIFVKMPGGPENDTMYCRETDTQEPQKADTQTAGKPRGNYPKENQPKESQHNCNNNNNNSNNNRISSGGKPPHEALLRWREEKLKEDQLMRELQEQLIEQGLMRREPPPSPRCLL